MNIKNAKIKNFKGVKIVDISTEKNIIMISGGNGEGKSSVLDGIMTTLGGKDKAIIRPIRDGASKSENVIELDGYTVSRTFRQGKGQILHVTPNGKTESIKAPQAWLNEHIGNLKFDPSEFAKMKESDQRELLMELAGLDLDTEDKKIADLFDERKFLGRELKNIACPNSAEIEVSQKYKDKEEINIIELSKEISEQKENKMAYNTNNSRISEIEGQIKALKEEHAGLVNRNATIPVLSDEDFRTLEIRLENAEGKNKLIRTAKQILAEAESWKKKDEEHSAKSEELEKARDTKKQLIEAATYPIEGLSVNDEGVIYNDIPFSQINESRQIIIGALIALALVPEGGIKSIFIKTASLLDDKALDYLDEVAEKKKAKFFLEFVNGDKGFVIEEGEVKKDE